MHLVAAVVATELVVLSHRRRDVLEDREHGASVHRRQLPVGIDKAATAAAALVPEPACREPEPPADRRQHPWGEQCRRSRLFLALLLMCHVELGVGGCWAASVALQLTIHTGQPRAVGAQLHCGSGRAGGVRHLRLHPVEVHRLAALNGPAVH